MILDLGLAVKSDSPFPACPNLPTQTPAFQDTVQCQSLPSQRSRTSTRNLDGIAHAFRGLLGSHLPLTPDSQCITIHTCLASTARVLPANLPGLIHQNDAPANDGYQFILGLETPDSRVGRRDADLRSTSYPGEGGKDQREGRGVNWRGQLSGSCRSTQCG